MISVKRIQSEIFNSNVYIITSSLTEEVFLIDCGAYKPVTEALQRDAVVKGIFLTHYHYDHIYYLEAWSQKFPDMAIYGSSKTLQGLNDPKKNFSFYHNNPISFYPASPDILGDGQEVPLFDGTSINVYETEGHCEGSLSFGLEHYFFTGDALIPNIPIVTKLKTGNKLLAKKSVQRIKELCTDQTVICPGHLETRATKDVNWNFYLND